jgi:hypothetical protein
MRSYIDITGQAVDRPPAIPPRWRIACYPIIRRDGMVLMFEPVWAGRWELPDGECHEDRLPDALGDQMQLASPAPTAAA